MASIYKRGRVWWIHYIVAGKSVCRSLKTTSQRVALERKKQLEALQVTDQLVRPSSIPIKPLLQSFCEFLLGTRRHKSAKNDISYLRSFFGPCCTALQPGSRVPHKFRGNRRTLPTVPDKLGKCHVPVGRLEQISTEMINAFIRNRVVQDGIAPKTANRIREILHRMFSYAIEHNGYVCPDRRYRNPVEGVRRAKEPAPTITWLNADEIRHQLDILKPWPVLRAMVATYIFAGLRREEALWMTVDDVDLERRMIHIRAKEMEGEFWQPKTKRNRSVPVSRALFSILRAYRQPVKSNWYFPGSRGRRWDPDDFSKRLRLVNKPAGLNWSCLEFRHTFGSLLAMKGESLYKIAELMGNSPEICRRHYAALVPEKMHDVVEFDLEAKKNLNVENQPHRALLEELLQELRRANAEVEAPRLQFVR
ncbi:MAG: tyrosine-type recombinase/integrase [bacterium]|nr:tyrosine-type recombinase/integrase [bacterium]